MAGHSSFIRIKLPAVTGENVRFAQEQFGLMICVANAPQIMASLRFFVELRSPQNDTGVGLPMKTHRLHLGK